MLARLADCARPQQLSLALLDVRYVASREAGGGAKLVGLKAQKA
jgi:hypothetical protein